MENKKYYLGIDMGTNSVGWCLTDQNYKIIKKNGKSLWGVRLFTEAKDCSERRSFRSNRRRLMRRRERLNLLRDLFAPEIYKIDKNFFMRLDYSKFFLEDRPEEINLDKDYLFPKETFGNNEKYQKKYPTIYHLRKELVEANYKVDLRLIFLVLNHMIKYRGNFLSDGVDFNAKSSDTIEKAFNNINDLISELKCSHEDDDGLIPSFDSKTISTDIVKWFETGV